ncbi:helix-hairpin-helix domain-containing protein [Salinisphaera sp. T31B1]|uniref:ComEA family DNA-binding protein n=1 Tax=Salinisphaera sp. T31B1 TaxID=727963 RepID=UPI003342A93E
MKKLLLGLFVALSVVATAALAAVNVNTADADQLAQLSGIGPAKASAIVEDRQENGDYAKLDELTRVSGIGSKTVDSLRDEATVGGD